MPGFFVFGRISHVKTHFNYVKLPFGTNFAVNQQVRPVFKKNLWFNQNQRSQCPAKNGEVLKMEGLVWVLFLTQTH